MPSHPHHDPSAGASAARTTAGCLRTLMPSHTRYSEPAMVSTVSAPGMLAISPPTPAATTSVATRCPYSIPRTAGTVRRASPAVIAYAQSAPGVITNKTDTPQNAQIAAESIFFSLVWKKSKKDHPEGVTKMWLVCVPRR
ncbi:hypothetical protein MIPYR_20442 [uncultured Microbacterium sp.]|uniref:Uncharacterized protein n=1 Tax=uncultured Microbacterium sp. TaxID=191216 RepID=A0A1Y5P0K3_9MICO|nr:hypothetical protein MIPYR_20442 [uncultured Microbacterium sp.]